MGRRASWPDETWEIIYKALTLGTRGLPGGSSVRRLLGQRAGKRRRSDLPPLDEEQILTWADDFHARHGRWPSAVAGTIEVAPWESWVVIDQSLKNGHRGLPGGSSLAQLLAAHRGKRNFGDLPSLTEEQILLWADAYHARHGKWPTQKSGRIEAAAGETWATVARALLNGRRGLPCGSSLAKLLCAQRGKRNSGNLPSLTEEQILLWVDAYHARHGKWPTRKSGRIETATGETWATVARALLNGRRGLPGGSSLAKLLDRCRRKVPQLAASAVSVGSGLSRVADAPENGGVAVAETLTRRAPTTSPGRPIRIRPK